MGIAILFLAVIFLDRLTGFFNNIFNFFSGVRSCLSNSKEDEKQKFKEIHTRGVLNAVGQKKPEKRTYAYLYQELSRHHSEDIKRAKNKYFQVNPIYFQKTLSGVNLDIKDKSLYSYPLFYKKSWIRSMSKGRFGVSLTPLDLGYLERELGHEDSDNAKGHELGGGKGKQFLKHFGISDYVDFLRKDCEMGDNFWDQDTYDIFKVREVSDGIVLSCCSGSYFNFIKTYELCQKEFYYNHAHRKNTFVLRKAIKFNFLEDFRKRPAKVGLNVFLIMKRKDGGYSTFLQQRSDRLMEYPGYLGVVPSGTFQPMSAVRGAYEEYSFAYSIFRELLEEFFKLEGAVKTYDGGDPLGIFCLPVEKKSLKQVFPGKYFLEGNPNLKKLSTKNYEIIPTGFFIDISSFKPELTFILHIKTPELHNIVQKYLLSSWEGGIVEYDLAGNMGGGDFFEKFLRIHLNNGKTVPAGAVAICEGMRWYLDNLAKDFPIESKKFLRGKK
ncbi:MAG: hypothetical protein JW727_06070 [Candidatus Aenigmarchaeota archaeon]|nr:hypothetical protein [Candidatus Aenigmarchaeota archaeon]